MTLNLSIIHVTLPRKKSFYQGKSGHSSVLLNRFHKHWKWYLKYKSLQNLIINPTVTVIVTFLGICTCGSKNGTNMDAFWAYNVYHILVWVIGLYIWNSNFNSSRLEIASMPHKLASGLKTWIINYLQGSCWKTGNRSNKYSYYAFTWRWIDLADKVLFLKVYGT